MLGRRAVVISALALASIVVGSANADVVYPLPDLIERYRSIYLPASGPGRTATVTTDFAPDEVSQVCLVLSGRFMPQEGFPGCFPVYPGLAVVLNAGSASQFYPTRWVAQSPGEAWEPIEEQWVWELQQPWHSGRLDTSPLEITVSVSAMVAEHAGVDPRWALVPSYYSWPVEITDARLVVTPVPEPATCLLLMAGGLGLLRRRRA
jgi:hypothetical protein